MATTMAPAATGSHKIRACISLVVLLAFSGIGSSTTVVKKLPGYPGELPFNMETGYISVGDLDEIQLFYYFIESERDPVTDPFMFWMTGGPGCSGLSAILYEIGPFKIDVDTWNGGLPNIIMNPYSWTKVANILFIDQPVGTGFSYATIESSYNTSDTLAVDQAYTFLRKWMNDHPQYLLNPLYIGGDSYSGIVVPLLVQKLLDHLERDLMPQFSLQGYVLGNPVTDGFVDDNNRIPYVHRVSLISDSLYSDAKEYCNGNYLDIDFNNSDCVTTLQTIKECLLQINLVHILEPQCAFSSKNRTEIEWDFRKDEATTVEYLLQATQLIRPLSKLPELKCRSFGYMLSHKWVNDDSVRTALGVRNGTVETWMRCAKTLSTYTSNVNSTIAYHKNFSSTGLRALIYSGDHDISVPWIATLDWIMSLDIAVFDEWRPWYYNGQVGGFQTVFMSDTYSLFYATLKGAGHTAPEYKPEPALAMIDRYFAYYPI